MEICKIEGTPAFHPSFKTLQQLFGGWQETMIWSCLDGTMGELYISAPQNSKSLLASPDPAASFEEQQQVCGSPDSAIAALGDFCFFAGKPDARLVSYWHDRQKKFFIIVPQTESWGRLIEDVYQTGARKVTRYAFKKEPGVFDTVKLQKAWQALPPGYTMEMIDEKLYDYCRKTPWCWDFVSQYADYETFHKLGLGVLILKDGAPVSGASSYTRYKGGIEIEIDTLKEYTRQGLAYACASRLILECLERGLYPSWDAQNKWSVGLAEKLGYHFDHEYTAYEAVPKN